MRVHRGFLKLLLATPYIYVANLRVIKTIDNHSSVYFFLHLCKIKVTSKPVFF